MAASHDLIAGELRLIDEAIRRLTKVHDASRPFLCDGSPVGCEVAIVGINPGTDTPFWPYWNLEDGFNKDRWLADNRTRKAGKRTPTRDRIELFIDGLRPHRVLELNIFDRFSDREAGLAKHLRDVAVLEYMLGVAAVGCLFVHGTTPQKHLSKMFGVALKPDQFVSAEWLGRPVEIFTAHKHLAYVSGGDAYVRDVAAQLKAHISRSTGTTNTPMPKVATEKAQRSSIGSEGYSLALLREQYPSGRKVPLSESEVLEVMARGKYCSRCSQLLPASAFAPSPQSATGLRSACRQCISNARRRG